MKDNQLKASGPSVPATSMSQVSAYSEGQNPQTEDQDSHLDTKSRKLKLIHQDVIYHIKDVHRDDLLDLVHSALEDCKHRMPYKNFFERAKVLEDGNVDVSICSKCS